MIAEENIRAAKECVSCLYVEVDEVDEWIDGGWLALSHCSGSDGCRSSRCAERSGRHREAAITQVSMWLGKTRKIFLTAREVSCCDTASLACLTSVSHLPRVLRTPELLAPS